jgi:hypothetical protein
LMNVKDAQTHPFGREDEGQRERARRVRCLVVAVRSPRPKAGNQARCEARALLRSARAGKASARAEVTAVCGCTRFFARFCCGLFSRAGQSCDHILTSRRRVSSCGVLFCNTTPEPCGLTIK